MIFILIDVFITFDYNKVKEILNNQSDANCYFLCLPKWNRSEPEHPVEGSRVSNKVPDCGPRLSGPLMGPVQVISH